MWFKNLQLYRLPSPWAADALALEQQLARAQFQRCAASDLASHGFVPPLAEGGLLHSVGGQWLIAFKSEQKLLPASVVNQVAQERAEEIEAQQGYKPGRKQMKELKEAVTAELLPRAFTRLQTTYAWLDAAGGWLAVDASSRSKAEAVIDLLHKTLDDLPLKLLRTELSPAGAMSQWLAAGEAPAGFTIDRDCELKAADEEQSAVRYVRHALEGDEIRNHLVAGKLPTRLALTWNDRLSFVLTDDLEIKRLDFLAMEEEKSDADNPAERFDADFALMSGELRGFIPDLLEALGGEPAAESGPAGIASPSGAA
ncbi:MAG: recombination-associated protein RdgC [Rhodocyclaceae bacterium]|nr:recombination-associated protein RdgC [Rhodocyclaceae bacterium]MBX3667889.1 recombination-associated protein RdgC [Rhodocyclaceae bacterium]